MLTNCVVWNNGGANTIINNAASTTATYSLFEPTVTGYTSVTGNITATTSPFADTATSQLAPCSPAINAGDPATTTATGTPAAAGVTDLAGNPRFFAGGRIDMGAYEFQDSPSLRISLPNGSSFTSCGGQTIVLRAAISDFSISLNGAIATDFSIYTASFGPALSATTISGPVKFVGQLTDADQGCAAYPAGTFAGKVALIRRGTCGFSTKVKNAQDAGATGVLIFNNVAGETGGLGGTDATITIPTAGLSKTNGEAIVGALPTGDVMAKSRLVSYSWAPATGLSSTTGIAVNAAPTQTTAYTVTASAPGVCSSQTVITVTAAPVPTITITASPSLSVSPGQSITLTASGATSYTWSNGQTTNPLVIPSASPSIYTVTGLLGSCQSTTAPTVTVSPPVCGSVIYVTQSGAGSRNGSSWANAVPGSSLQAAINTAATCGSPTATVSVWVANGLYKPTDSPAYSPTDRTVSFSMRNGVTIYGGFVGTETALSQRPVVNLTTPSATTLSGEIGSPTSTTDNSYQVISNPTGLTTTAILDGFVITGGNANGPGDYNYGGGVYNKGYGSGSWCSPQIRNCFFLANSASFGGAILNDGFSSGNSSPILTNCSFQSNTAASQGGAMYNDGTSNGNSSPVLTNCSFQNNTATIGGAMRNIGNLGTSTASLTNCVLFGNGGINTIANSNATVSATYSLFETSAINYTSGPGNLTTTTSPFASTTSLQLAACSPAINAGDPATTSAVVGTTDLAGNPRFFAGGRIDMGAYELQATPAAAPTRLYVRANATGANTGLSWADAFTDLQSALTFPCSQSLTEVWVANGTYKPTSTTSRTVSFAMLPNVAIYGGFLGAETTLSQRPAINLTAPSGTTLSGDIGMVGNSADNSFHVISNSPNLGLTTSAILDGFVITGGNANGTNPYEDLGGGILNRADGANLCQPTIRNCLFTRNMAAVGGGIANRDGNANCSPTITNCVFTSNTASGGGIQTQSASATVTGCLFANNGFAYGGGGIENNSATGFISSCTFVSNVANVEGGGVRNAFCPSPPRIVNCEFVSNSSFYGGGMRNWTASPLVQNCSFRGNSAQGQGGGILNFSASAPVITNSEFLGNMADQGGGVANESNSSATLVNCSFSGNTAINGGAIANVGSSPGFRNTIVWGNSSGVYNSDNTSVPSYTATAVQSLSLGAGVVNGSTDPLFVSQPPVGLGTAGNLRLQTSSPAINAGDPATTSALVGTTDLAGNPRFVNTLIDMGATEFQGILEVFTLKDGLWNDASMWSVGRLPLASERVRLKHVVTIPTGHLALSGTLIYDLGSKLIYEVGGRLRLGQ